MDDITIAISAFEPTLLSAGLTATISTISEVSTVNHFDNEITLMAKLAQAKTHILLVVIRGPHDIHYQVIDRVRFRHPQLPIIAVAPEASRDMLFKVIKCGANGFLSGDTTRQEMSEALFSVRSGHDYYCASVTSLMITNYTDALRRNQTSSLKEIELLSKRELEILELWGDGKTNPEIADKLYISTRTVESHKNHIMQKLKIRTTVDLLKFAIRNNIIPL